MGFITYDIESSFDPIKRHCFGGGSSGTSPDEVTPVVNETSPQAEATSVADSQSDVSSDAQSQNPVQQNDNASQSQSLDSSSQNDANSQASSAPINTDGIVANGEQPAFTQQPTDDVTKVEPNQGIQIDWSRPYDEIEQNPLLQQMKPYDIMRDFAKNGNGDYASFMPWLQSLGDVDKTVAANAALQKKAEKQAKWEQWGNLFQHVGNFFGTVQGAPPQKIESAQELTDRQRKMREATDALRAKGYDQMMVNIYKERQAKQAQMQAEAAAKVNDARAAYFGAQQHQVEAMTPVKVEEAAQSARQHSTGADLNVSKKQTEDALRGKKGELLTAQTNNANAGAAEHAAGVKVKGAQVRHINSQTEGQKRKNAEDKEADDFNNQRVNNPTFKKYTDQWASHNGMAVGGNDGTGGTWANKNNRQQASSYAKAMIAKEGKKRTVRPYGGKPAKGTSSTKVDYSKYIRK